MILTILPGRAETTAREATIVGGTNLKYSILAAEKCSLRKFLVRQERLQVSRTAKSSFVLPCATDHYQLQAMLSRQQIID